jgi:predicted glutamine amidotransferase
MIWSPSGKIPKDHVLRAMERHQDGWGFSVVTRSGLRTYKSVSRHRFLAAWETRVRGMVLFHARWATHGAVACENCHPFVVRGHGMVAAHNGVLAGYGSAHVSDTRDFLEREVERMPNGFLDDQDVVDDLERRIGSSKIAFMDGTGSTVILNEHLGAWIGHLWYSNLTIFDSKESGARCRTT